MPTNPAQSKFQVITATALPHRCVACSREATGRNQFIDFDVSFDFEGALYICVPCGEEIARTLGFITSEERDAVLLELAKAQEALEEVTKRADSLGNVISAYGVIPFNVNEPSRVPRRDAQIGEPLFDIAADGSVK